MPWTMWGALILALALFAALLVPYLFEEISRGKVELGPRIPLGAGDTHPGSRNNPTPGQPVPQAPDHETVSLGGFHIVLIWLSTALAAGTGVWAMFHSQILLAVLSFGGTLLLIAYSGYFRKKLENAHLE